jgi:hypothetical protein
MQKTEHIRGDKGACSKCNKITQEIDALYCAYCGEGLTAAPANQSIKSISGTFYKILLSVVLLSVAYYFFVTIPASDEKRMNFERSQAAQQASYEATNRMIESYRR